MNRLNRDTIFLLGLGMIVALGAQMSATPTLAEPPPEAGPVISGTVDIGNVPLPVTLNGETVNVSEVVVVTEVPATVPFERPFTSDYYSPGFYVPDGKQFVAEAVSFRSDMSGGFVFHICESLSSGCGGGHWVSTASAVEVAGIGYVGSSPVRFYAGPGRFVQFGNYGTGTTYDVILTGHLEDVP